jgi:H+-transporting ATPase
MNGKNISSEDAKNLMIEKLFDALDSGKKGLTSSDAKERLSTYGNNEILEKKVSPMMKFLGYFWGPISWMIEVAVVLSAVIRNWDDFWVILALLLINAFVRFLQESRADNAIEMLKRKLALNARVLRDGGWKDLPARELVPGDVVRMRLGDIVPADIKLFGGEYLSVDESALTGESLPVEKHAGDISYSGALIRQGEMEGLVVSTGMNTYFGKTTKLVEEAKTHSHFQKAVIKIGDYLIALSIVLVAVVFTEALFRHESFLHTFQFALVLIVAAIPAALPAVLSVTMAVGAVVLAKKDAIVSKLLSIEEMAGMDVLCSDKTGTITKNELAVVSIMTFHSFSESDVLLYGALASREEDRDPIDEAIIGEGKSMRKVSEALGTYEVIGFKPFDPVAKRTEASVEDKKDRAFKISKGAPQVILSLVGDRGKFQKEVEDHVGAFAEKGYRALGIARTDSGGKWQYVGLVALSDSPREDSAETIKDAQQMGVKVKMVTGDHMAIAKEIAHEVNLGTNIKSVSSFLDKTDREATRIVEEVDGFAEVFPEHKYHIVELLQNKDHIVGMTGDGVNDAPALKKADVGIAVAGATDAAKSASDIVFTKPGLAVIIDAIKTSRKIFERMNSYAIYRIAETLRVLLFLSLSILMFKIYPVTAIMIVILALLNDIPIMMIAYDHTKLVQSPVRWEMRQVLGIATLLGVFGVIESFIFFLIAREMMHLDQSMLQTIIFLKLAVAGHMTIYLARTGERSFWTRPLPSPHLFLTSELTQIAATLFAVYGIFMTPIGWKLAGFVWGYALVFFLIANFTKIGFFKLIDHTEIKFSRLKRRL